MLIHVVAILLGSGTRLFDSLQDANIELERTRVLGTPTVTHLGFRVLRPPSSVDVSPLE
jgi:hypothetical protein